MRTHPKLSLALNLTPTVLLVCFGLASFGGNAQEAEHGDSLTTRRLTIVDGEGRAVARLEGGDSGGRLSVLSSEGRELVHLGTDELGGVIRTLQSDGRPATSLRSYPVSGSRTAGMVETFDHRSETAVALGAGGSDAEGAPVSMGASCEGGVVVFFQDGRPRRLDACRVDELFPVR